jgi:osmotically inducible protein OsmC
MPVRNARAHWQGTIKAGNGHMQFANYDGPFTWSSRFEGGAGTNPEELIGAAIAGCFSMALSEDVELAGHKPTEVRTSAKVHIEKKPGGGFSITKIELDSTAKVPGMAKEAFLKVAESTKKNCPVSRALSVPISLDARLA